jgi:hypothetical protein
MFRAARASIKRRGARPVDRKTPTGTDMQRRTALGLAAGSLAGSLLVLAGCASGLGDAGWATLIDDGKGLDNFNRLGDANWRVEGGLIVADKGKGGFLVSKSVYKDFALRAEFWAETDTNSGIFLRLSDSTTVTAGNSYEVNIWDIRPEPRFGTGAIVDFAAVSVPLTNKAGGRWNTFEIEARGSVVSVKLNGLATVTMDNGKFASGPIALQYGAGVQGVQGGPIKWRKVQIKQL